jgi:hypothetical protein
MYLELTSFKNKDMMSIYLKYREELEIEGKTEQLEQ